MPRLSAFAANTAGAAAIEFALLGSLFFTLLLGHIEVGYLMFLQHRLDDGTVAAVRSIQIGQTQREQDDTVEKFKANRLCPAVGTFIDCSRIVVDTAILPSSNALFDPNSWANTAIGQGGSKGYCVGSAGEYMMLRVSYPQAPIVGGLLPDSMFTLYKGQRVTMLQTFAALRIEPVEAKRAGPCE